MEVVAIKTVEIVRKHLPTLDEAIAKFSPGEGCEMLDSRDASRLAMFVPAARLSELGLKLNSDCTAEQHDVSLKPWDAESVANQIASDVAFAFKKALDQRGISASLMNEVLEMWHGLLSLPFVVPDYPQYGLPMCRMMATYLELPNEIGDNYGDEDEYACD